MFEVWSIHNSEASKYARFVHEVRDSGDTKVITVKPFEADAVKRMNLGNEARRAARKSGLKAGAVRVIGDKRKKPARHKKPLRGDE